MAGRLVAFDHPFLRARSGPFGLWDDPWSFQEWPSRLLDQNFGTGLFEDELLPPSLYRGVLMRPRRQTSQTSDQTRGLSEVINDDKQFKVSMDVSHFSPEELQVKNVEDRVVVYGNHEEKQDEHGFIQRQFKRSYVLPKEIDPETLKTSLSADGVLSIFAPKPALEGPKERAIPIERAPAQTEQAPAQTEQAPAQTK